MRVNVFNAENAAGLTKVGRSIGRWLGHESIPQMAAALAYRTIFSLIPIIILSLLVLRLFQDERALVEKMLGRVFDVLGISQIGENEMSAQAKIEEIVRSFSGLSFTGIGLVTAGTLIYAAMSLIIEVENAFNRIYGVSRGRSMVRRLMQYWMLLTLGPLLIFASFYTAERAETLAQTLAGEGSALGPYVTTIAAFIISVFITGALLVTLYLVIPNAKVTFRAALLGGFIAAVMLEAGKFGFRIYLEHVRANPIYGSLALIPIFLLWVYITWVIVLFGLRSAYLLQNGRRLAMFTVLNDRLHLAQQQSWVEPGTAIILARHVAQAFTQGKRVDADQLSHYLALPDATIRQVIDPLKEAGILVPTAEPGRGEKLTLARPASQITLASVLRVGHELAGPPASSIIQDLRNAELAALGERTLADPDVLATPPLSEIAALAAHRAKKQTAEEAEEAERAANTPPVDPRRDQGGPEVLHA